LTLIERFKSRLARRPHDVWRVLQSMDAVPNSTMFWAWFADACGVFEASDTSDPVEMARADGMRSAFFLLFDMKGADGRELLDLQAKALERGSD